MRKSEVDALRALCERGESWSYEVGLACGRTNFAEAMEAYRGALNSLVSMGLALRREANVLPSGETLRGRARVYYKVTDAGEAALKAETTTVIHVANAKRCAPVDFEREAAEIAIIQVLKDVEVAHGIVLGQEDRERAFTTFHLWMATMRSGRSS